MLPTVCPMARIKGYCCQSPDVRVGTILSLWILKENERADERTRTTDLISLRVIYRALQGVANPAYFRGFLFCALSCISPYCVLGGVRVVQAIPSPRPPMMIFVQCTDALQEPLPVAPQPTLDHRGRRLLHEDERNGYRGGWYALLVHFAAPPVVTTYVLAMMPAKKAWRI